MRIAAIVMSMMLVGLSACSQPSEENASSPNNPKTLYGQSVKKARDLQKPSEQDDETKRQADELMDNE
ncbi:MAG: hypothetical protein J0M12_08270 [Deltaproteobacteria bacterium]|nr:hypothetical protein [Deltaproteobacteria bacterium]